MEKEDRYGSIASQVLIDENGTYSRGTKRKRVQSTASNLWLFNFQGASSEREKPLVVWGCSSVGRAPALQAGGQEFESLHLHQSGKKRGKNTVKGS